MLSDPREWIAASLVPGVGPATLAQLHARQLRPMQLLELDLPSCFPLRHAAGQALRSVSIPSLLDQADQVLRRALQKGIGVLALDDAAYPPLLKQIADPPPLLWWQGNLDLLHLPQLAVVGSRKPSHAGVKLAREYAAHLAQAGFVITSGLAQGIDAAAHQGTVERQKAGVAVLGAAIDCLYPRSNIPLAAQLLAQGGCLVSEQMPGTPPHASLFPRRNRIISGLSVGVLVVEAALRSGSLITARQALEQGREVFALPGALSNPLSRGCHALIREGATLVYEAQHIVEPLAALCGYLASTQDDSHVALAPTAMPVQPEQQQIMQLLQPGSMTLDALMRALKMECSELQQHLSELELLGQVERVGEHVSAC